MASMNEAIWKAGLEAMSLPRDTVPEGTRVEILALADRLENHDLWPDEKDYYMPEITPAEMLLIVAALRTKAGG